MIERQKTGFKTKYAPKDTDLYKCVHCGFCLSACPTYIETGLESESPRGRIALMKAVRENRLEITPNVMSHWDSCLQCRACEIACPSGVEFGKLISGAKSEIVELKIRSLSNRFIRKYILNFVFAKLYSLNILSKFLSLYNFFQIRNIVNFGSKLKLIPKTILILNSASPKPDGPAFNPPVISGQGNLRIALLKGCVMPIVEGNAMRSVVSLLMQNNITVVVPKNQGCCGALNHHSGEHKTAESLAKNNIDAFLTENYDYILIASAGCSSATKEYPLLFEEGSEYHKKAKILAGKTKDLHEFLIEKGIKKPEGKINKRVVLQEPCHSINAQRITDEPRLLLNQIPGLEVITLENPNQCCGSAGIYSVTNFEMSTKVTKRKMDQILQHSPDIIATCNPGCSMQMKSYLRNTKSKIVVKHIAELIDESYKLGEK